MNFGALPVVLKAATSETVSATLGHSAVGGRFSKRASSDWSSCCSQSLFYSRGLGLVVISGLVLTAMLLWAIISALGHTSVAPSFDLAGITGLIVSIEITVDSYIVYFERLKDETRSGRSVRTSVDRGFKSAWRTVWAADFVSLLAAIVLYLVAVGEREGLRFLPRPVHHHGHGDHLVLPQATRHPHGSGPSGCRARVPSASPPASAPVHRRGSASCRGQGLPVGAGAAGGGS